MQQGISIYFGLDHTYEENINLLNAAAQCGIKKIFTSLHIPEANYQEVQEEIPDFLKAAKAADIEVITDISPYTLKMLGIKKLSFSMFRAWGIQTVRTDFGYDVASIAKFTNNEKGIRIQLNASTVTAAFLMDLARNGANFKNLSALHNFYPRIGTGLTEEFLCKKNALLQQWGVPIGAFVTSNHQRRAPLKDGLPTLEAHRGLEVSLAARHLAALGINNVFIGDAIPSKQELIDLAKVKDDCVEINIQLLTKDPIARELLTRTFTARTDEARDAIRAQESRILLKETLTPENTLQRPCGAITLDNLDYGRYMGELQIIKTPQCADPRVNVVATVLPEEEFLLKYITPEKKYAFHFASESLPK